MVQILNSKKFKYIRALLSLLLLLSLLTACFKKAPDRPASVEEPKSLSPVPFSRGPSGPPKVSAPTYPPPGQ